MAIIGCISTLDTKSEIVEFFRKVIERRGHRVLTIDVSLGHEASTPGDISCDEVAKAGGSTIEEIRLISGKERRRAVQVMIEGATKKILDRYAKGELDGLVGIGCATNTLIGTSVMKALPFGFPKLMVSDHLSGPYAPTISDITAHYPVVCSFGLNEFLKAQLTNAAGAISGMVEIAEKGKISANKPLIAMTVYGFMEKGARSAWNYLKERGYEVIPFHSNGQADKAMDHLIQSQKMFDGVLDLVSSGLHEELHGGGRPGGPLRLKAAAEAGVPQVVVPNGYDFISYGALEFAKARFGEDRKIWILDDVRIHVRASFEEMQASARAMAEILNKALGPAAVILPLKGLSSSLVSDPEADKPFIDELKKLLDPNIVKIVEVDANADTSEVGLMAAKTLISLLAESEIE